MKKSNRPVFIFDITSILFRMYCSGVEKTSQDGLEVGGVFGVALSMRKLFRLFRPQYIAAVFDAGQATVRNEIDETYKQNRPPPPDDLRHQFDLVVELVRSMGITTFQKRVVLRLMILWPHLLGMPVCKIIPFISSPMTRISIS